MAPGVRAVKVVVDRRPADAPSGSPVVYFLNSRNYDLHITFIRQNRLVPKDQVRNIQLESWRSESRRFFFCQLARYEEAGRAPVAVVEIFDEDKAPARLVAELMTVVQGATQLKGLAFKPNSLVQEALRSELTALQIPMLPNDALAGNRLFQVVHAGRPATGRLRIVTETDPAAIEALVFNRNEIVLLQSIPNDITRVAGVITTRPTTPLSHVSLRARTWNIPNVMLKEALNIAYKEGLEEQWVRLEVTSEGIPRLRRATQSEVAEAEAARKVETPSFKIPPVDLSYREMPDLFTLQSSDVGRVGAKAANLGELASLTQVLAREDLEPVLKDIQGRWLADALGHLPRWLPRNPKRLAKTYLGKLHVPPGFAIPVVAWKDFLSHPANAQIQARIDALMADARFKQDAPYRKAQLEALQEQIRGGTIPPEWADRILARIRRDLPDRRLFIRSSTNCEDLEGFNGAGLYETVGNVEGDEAVLGAVKRVWASIWGFRAYEAREDFGIDHLSVYPGILVQEAVKPYAAGVLISKDILNAGGGYRFYLNANPGFGENTVNSGRGAPEQVYGNPATGQVQRISLSERGGDLLTDTEVQQLVFFSAVIERHFGRKAGRFPYPQDVEWLVVDGRISIVQTRPYLESAAAQAASSKGASQGASTASPLP